MKVTIKDIARICNVSVTTVSRVINQKTENISVTTVEKVEKVIKDLDYVPNSIARSMITGKTHTVGLVLPDINNPFFSELARGVEDYMNIKNYGVFLCNTDSSLEKEKQYIDLLKGRFADGILFTTQNTTECPPYFESFIHQDYPVILIERYVEQKRTIPGVYFDNHGGALDITRLFIANGHSRIACITGPLDTTNSLRRLDGYKDALKEAGIPYDESIIIQGDYRYQSGYDCIQELVNRPSFSDVTAIFACNDLMAYGAYQALQEKGYSIPEDYSLAGFDNTNFPKVFEPKITTVDLPAYDMGRRAARMLYHLLKREQVDEPIYVYPLDVIDKGSIKKIPST